MLKRCVTSAAALLCLLASAAQAESTSDGEVNLYSSRHYDSTWLRGPTGI
jgi:hypothetical protein